MESTLAEQGFPLEITSDRSWVLPKGRRKAVIDYYTGMLEKVAMDKQFIEAVEAKGSFVKYMRGDEYVKWWQDTATDWTRIAKNLGVYRMK